MIWDKSFITPVCLPKHDTQFPFTLLSDYKELTVLVSFLQRENNYCLSLIHGSFFALYILPN